MVSRAPSFAPTAHVEERDTSVAVAAIADNADRRLTAGSFIGTVVTYAGLLVPLLAWMIWEAVAMAEGVELPGPAAVAVLLPMAPGLVAWLRRRRNHEASVISPTTTILVMYWLILCIGVPSTWFFEATASYFYAYDRALIFFATFLAAKCLVRIVGIYLVRSPEPAPVTDMSRIPGWVLLGPQLFLFGIIALRISLGAYFHGASGDFMHTSPYFGPLMMLSQVVMLLMPAGGAEILRRWGRGLPGSRFWAMAFLGSGAIHLVLATLRGGRTGILVVGMLYGLAIAFGLRRMRTRQLVGGLLVMVLLAVFAGVFRQHLHAEAGRKGTADVADVQSAAEVSIREVRSDSSAFKATMLRLDDFRPLAAVYQYYGGRELGGETFAVILADPVPRVFWPEKPKHSDLAKITGAILREGGSSPLTWPGEFFVNFGESGAIVGGILAGLAWILFDLLFDWRRRDPVALGFGATSWTGLSLFVGTMGGVIGALYKTMLVAIVIRWLVVRLYERREPSL